MALTMRPAGLSSPAFAHLRDWVVCNNGEAVGRIYEAVATPAEYRWFWSMTLIVDWRLGIVTNGKVASLEEAKTQWRKSWEAAAQLRSRLA
jgi:hypothetical protein